MLFIFIHYPQSKFPYPPLNIQKNCGKPTFFQVDDVPNRKPGVFHGFPHLSVCYPSVFSLICSMDGSQQAGTIYWTDPCPPCPTPTLPRLQDCRLNSHSSRLGFGGFPWDFWKDRVDESQGNCGTFLHQETPLGTIMEQPFPKTCFFGRFSPSNSRMVSWTKNKRQAKGSIKSKPCRPAHGERPDGLTVMQFCFGWAQEWGANRSEWS